MGNSEVAVIVGVGQGLSAALARLLAAEGARVVLAARNVDKLAPLAAETGARAVACDASEAGQVEALFADVDAVEGGPSLVVFNPSRRVPGPLVEADPEEVRKSLMITAFGGFLVGQAAARRMLAAGGGSILFTGASASVKGYPRSAAFAMGKFALRGLVQSMARELAPRNIHVAHFVIDGGIRRLGEADDGGDAMLHPDAIARSYLHVHRQHRSAWTWEMELRPWVENF
ncbi:MAG: SDR family NAD(P)-dependent oxidoreductase [Gammaproteobacteria bacterium]|nr:SDR family NAD(P)-dependent oxidoreductase [Gammaproteobacteria bacterium]NIP89899.1 SDR family NAD(P)-dependent oxidoreductase [Gammaproteobacteria bacterium]NIR24762.1 SDR family NAD(P)-dependent oxidoreductase [Gammaproteobacteria bacterium]NIS05109.1 SDR family NAD(P)-dependent oxidoreductase [Gammaproteobacteria bacterium]NIU42515.1 SDR family NAD(P)-dependent oxidoreductase [Gammaproteobacteria bacterium]